MVFARAKIRVNRYYRMIVNRVFDAEGLLIIPTVIPFAYLFRDKNPGIPVLLLLYCVIVVVLYNLFRNYEDFTFRVPIIYSYYELSVRRCVQEDDTIIEYAWKYS